jgi:hypothetical protein
MKYSRMDVERSVKRIGGRLMGSEPKEYLISVDEDVRKWSEMRYINSDNNDI